MVEARRPPADRPWLLVATALGLGHAAVSLLWALGSTWLLGTVGGQIEKWGREGGLTVGLVLAAVVVVKLVAVAAIWIGVRRGHRLARLVGWTAAGVLVVYGGLLTTVQSLALSGVVQTPPGADREALLWHTVLWDPWFLLWGACAAVALWRSRLRHATVTPAAATIDP